LFAVIVWHHHREVDIVVAVNRHNPDMKKDLREQVRVEFYPIKGSIKLYKAFPVTATPGIKAKASWRLHLSTTAHDRVSPLPAL
jgi:hypothetical protein